MGGFRVVDSEKWGEARRATEKKTIRFGLEIDDEKCSHKHVLRSRRVFYSKINHFEKAAPISG